VTLHLPDGERMSIYDAAMRYQQEGVPLLVLAGKEYGTGSSRDWAAKGTFLLGVKAVLAESYERIHRSNLVGMGVLPSSTSRATARRPWAWWVTRCTTWRAWATTCGPARSSRCALAGLTAASGRSP